MTDGSDLAWLGLDRSGDGRWSFELRSPLSRPDGKLYGGTGAAVAVATIEAETARDALWTTVQFVGTAEIGERVDCAVEVLAGGRRTSQVRVTATVGDRLVFVALGSSGLARDGATDAQIPSMPVVPSPDECDDWGAHRRAAMPMPMPRTGWLEIAEMRQATPEGSIWARPRQGPQTRATAAFFADMVPTSVLRAVGKMGGGTSLDNSVRFGPAIESEWILLDMDPWLASGGYLHGAARLWSEDGTLVGIASQTASAVVMPAMPTVQSP